MFIIFLWPIFSSTLIDEPDPTLGLFIVVLTKFLFSTANPKVGKHNDKPKHPAQDASLPILFFAWDLLQDQMSSFCSKSMKCILEISFAHFCPVFPNLSCTWHGYFWLKT